MIDAAREVQLLKESINVPLQEKRMPHFVIDCSDSIVKQETPEVIMKSVHETALSTELFSEGDIKVRINPFSHYIVGGASDDFIHVFANIMEGRTTEQKKDLSDKVVGKLKSMFPDVPIISINIRDFEKATYCNKTMVD